MVPCAIALRGFNPYYEVIAGRFDEYSMQTEVVEWDKIKFVGIIAKFNIHCNSSFEFCKHPNILNYHYSHSVKCGLRREGWWRGC